MLISAVPMFEQCKPKVKGRSIYTDQNGCRIPVKPPMKNPAKIAIFTLLISGLSFAGQAKQPRTPSAQKAQVAAEPVQQAPVAPQVPPTPEHMPATAPRVTMSNGLLSITAENSTLGDVLNGVHAATGASVDVPLSAAAERVVVQIGPGEPREVLQQLLTGSKFDYIIVGSPQNELAVQRVILTPRSGGGATPPGAVAANHPPAYQPPPQQNSYQPPDIQDDSGIDENDNNSIGMQPEPSPEITMPPEPQPGQPGQAVQQDQNQQGPRTPEQLLQELQQMKGQTNQRPDRNPSPQ